jgi:hypothetical protein
MHNYIIVFLCHNNDPTTKHHYEKLVDLHPGVPVIPVTGENDIKLPNIINVGQVTEGWSNADKLIYRWWQDNEILAGKYIICEWDLLAEIPIPKFLEPVWNAQIAAESFFKQPGIQNWDHYITDSNKIPDYLKPFAAGIVPLGLLLFSNEALSRVCEHVPQINVFSELRLGTAINISGIEVTNFPAEVSKTISWHERYIFRQPYPTVYHPVKTLDGVK